MPSSGHPHVTVVQLQALAHPLRLRILRLCAAREHTNKELADALGIAPATALRHVRELLNAGFLAAGEVRSGSRGALERPYQATGASWHLDTCQADHPELAKQLQSAVVAAHLAELDESPSTAGRRQLRGTMRLDPDTLRQLADRIEALLREYGVRDDPDGTPVSFLWSIYETGP
jgi:DNA-binding transcriptional ArsR family regulator